MLSPNAGILKRFLFSTVSLSLCATAAAAAPTEIRTPNIINVVGATQVTLGGQTFINQGLQGMGRIAAGTPDFNGDTFGAFSGMDILPGSWRRNADGTYGGTLYALPDRGPNGIGQVSFSDYAGRASAFAIVFSPYTGTANLPAATSSQNQIGFTATGGVIFRDFNNALTTGLDANGTTIQNGIRFPSPATGAGAGKISLDAEGLRFFKDGSFYVSDEYGANVYYFDSAGKLQGAILPPPALLPRDAQGNLFYTSLTDAVTGRRFNQGLEGVAITPDSKKLVTLLQTGAYQDTTANQQDRTNTRLMIYDISSTRTPTTPIADYVLQLPVYTSNGNGAAPNRTAAQSEILALNDTQFLVLSRDGNGLGTANLNPVYKSILLVDTTGATNIAGTTYETTYTPISPGGVLNTAIKPVQQAELVNMLNATQLTKFGENLNNTTPTRMTLGEKWEGMALAPVLDENAPNDYFLFVGNDNDFLSTTCRVNGQDCSQAVNSDAHMLVYRLTLPTYVDAQNLDSMITTGPQVIQMAGHAAVGISGQNSGNIADQLDTARRAGAAAGETSVWVNGGYRDTDWDKFTAPGVNAKRFGFQGTFGADVEVMDGVRVGAAAGYGQSNAKVAGYKINADGYSLSAYASGQRDGVFAHGGLTYTNLTGEDITRPAAYGQMAVASPRGSGWAGYVQAGYMYDGGEVKIGPVAGYRYADASIDAYTETGASGGDVMYPKHTTTTSTGSIGAEVSGNWGDVSPYAQVFYNVAFDKSDRSVTLKLANVTAAMASQTVLVPNVNENSVSAGAGIQGRVGGALWHLGYTADFGDYDHRDQFIRFGVGFNF
ncbi:MAG: esterase-like activity of phytase family protein [Rhodospirillaceae bacterium]